METEHEQPKGEADQEGVVGEVRLLIPEVEVDDLQELEDSVHNTDHSSNQTKETPVATDHVNLAIVNVSEVNTNSKNGITEEGDPGEAVADHTVAHLHGRVGVHLQLLVGREEIGGTAGGDASTNTESRLHNF